MTKDQEEIARLQRQIERIEKQHQKELHAIWSYVADHEEDYEKFLNDSIGRLTSRRNPLASVREWVEYGIGKQEQKAKERASAQEGERTEK
jgi:hypothetical protein